MKEVVVDGVPMSLSQNLFWYYGRKEQDSPKPYDSRPSGAYVFRPNGTDAQPIANQATLTVQTGTIDTSSRHLFLAFGKALSIRNFISLLNELCDGRYSC